MPQAERAHLRVVDEQGELHEDCPGCIERQHALDELARKYQGALSQIGRLRADKDAEARAHEAWPSLLALFRYWGELTGHTRVAWTSEHFWCALPMLKVWGGGNLAAAIAGIAHDPNRKRRANGSWEVYDDWQTCLRNSGNVRRYIGRRPQGWTLPANLEPVAERWPRK